MVWDIFQFYIETPETHKSIYGFADLFFAAENGMSHGMTTYIWRVKSRLPERYMTPCRVLARGKMNSCLVEFEDGYRVVTSRNYLMKLETMEKRLRGKQPKDK
jgi:hypothetical protein